MSSFPNLSNLKPYIKTELDNRVEGKRDISKLNAWVRVSSGVGDGLVLLSNPSFKLFAAAGEGSIYGNGTTSGTLGTTWGGAAVSAETEDSGFRPKPNITSIEIDEGAGTLSRKASFTITCYTKGQLDTLCEYFLEPGYTIFLEWGWNVPESLNNYSPSLDVNTVASYQSFDVVNKVRENCGGTYDNYLGYITGGGISSTADTYEISVKCTGFTELPAYFMGADNSEKGVSDSLSAPEYNTAQIAGATSLGKKRFMMAFNRLPSNRRTTRVASLIDNPDVANESTFINVDETVKGAVNDKTSGTVIAGVSVNDEEADIGGGVIVEFPSGTMFVKDDAYIKFGALVQIINQIGIDGFKLGNQVIKTEIRTNRTACCAFPEIFSTDKSKLFIPNAKTPNFDLNSAANSIKPPEGVVKDFYDCSIGDGDYKIQFPAAGKIENGKAQKKNTGSSSVSTTIQSKVDATFISLTKEQGQWGFLDDLYVNLDFAKGILEAKNFSIKDGLYQILNGMSSAAGGIWDFQIIPNENNTQLKVIDLNLTPTNGDEPYLFVLAGLKSIFIDASLDMDISGAKMNQIIGNRLGATLNGSQKDVKFSEENTGLFTNKKDKVLTEIVERAKPAVVTPPEGGDVDIEEMKKKNLKLFLDKSSYMAYPKYQSANVPATLLTKDGTPGACFPSAYNDQSIFEYFKNKNDKDVVRKEDKRVGPIMPIKFTFTIHGISGIKRGDKFKVSGLPKNYEKNGFFQVTSVKHVISDMLWKTDIEGSFRQSS